ncbi:hypothetical protein L6R52_06045 [Myxococcota bacterium]|nr:hypothetical protein [Myxococcota bacterium]
MVTTNTTRPSGDPQLTMIEAAYYRQQLALGELSSLAEDQKANNDQMKAIRGLQDELRKMLSDGAKGGDKHLDVTELEGLKARAAELGIDISAHVDSILGMINGESGNKSFIWVNDGSNKHVKDLVDQIKESLSSALDDVKSDASSKELDIQRVSQEVSTWTQMASTLLKKFNDTIMAVIRNIA